MEPKQSESATTKQRQESGRARIARFPYQLRVTFFLVLLGIGLRAWACLRATSLYLDEVLLSRNILDLPLRQLLTQPLALDRVAPRGFLLVERLAVTLFGPNEPVSHDI